MAYAGREIPAQLHDPAYPSFFIGDGMKTPPAPAIVVRKSATHGGRQGEPLTLRSCYSQRYRLTMKEQRNGRINVAAG